MIRLPESAFGKKLFVLLLVLIPVLVGIVRYIALHSSPTAKAQKFEISQSYPEDQSTNVPLVSQPVIVFTKKITIPESQLSNYFEITPKINGSWHIEKNKQVVYFSVDKKQKNTLPNTFEPQKVYTIRVKGGLGSEEGKRLSKNFTVQFRTERSPEFAFGFDKRQISLFRGGQNIVVPYRWSYGDPANSYKITRFRESNPKITVQKATKEEFLEYFSYKEGKESLNIAPESLVKKEKVEVRGDFREGSYNEGSITIQNPIFDKSGIYYLTIANKDGSDGMFVVVSDNVAQLIKDDNNSYVWVTKGKEGISYKDVDVSAYSVVDEVKKLSSGKTDASGIFKKEKGANDIDFVIAQKGDDVSVTYVPNYSKSPTRDKLTVFAYLDRPVYRPGDTVHYKAVIRKNEDETLTVPNRTLYIKYMRSYFDNEDTYKKVTTDEYGTVTFDATIPLSNSELYPSITLNEKKEDGTYTNVSSTPVMVETYRKPDMELNAVAQEKEYISGDTAHYTVVGKTMFGQPLSNIEFSYRIILNNWEEIVDRQKEAIDNSGGYYGGGDELSNGVGKFDQNGKAEISFPAVLPPKYELSQTALIEITPKIQAAPSIGKMVRLVHRGEFALFIDPLTGSLDRGIEGTVTAMDHNSPRNIVGGKQGKAALYYTANYSNNEELVTNQDVTIDPNGKAQFKFEASRGQGRYIVKILIPDSRGNTVVAKKELYVGNSQYQDPLKKYTLSLTSAKNEYASGETARLTANANFTIQEALIVKSIANGYDTKIIDVSVKKLSSNSNSFDQAVVGNSPSTVGYTIVTVHDGQVVSSTTNIVKKKEKTELNVDLKFDKDQYNPGDTVTAMLKVADKDGKGMVSDNSLSVIDASLLQVESGSGGIDATFNQNEFYLYVTMHNSTTGIDAFGPGGGGGCFLGGTDILMSDGSTKNIEDIRVGDMVLTRESAQNSTLVPVRVSATFVHTVDDYLIINNRLFITPIHKVYLNGIWQTISNAKVGDVLIDASGQDVVIESISESKGSFKVYNLTTEEKHTFFANGIYVHNEKGVDERKNFVDSVYWNPHITTDSNGDAKVTFKLPDNLTTFSAQVFSNTKDSHFGEVKKTIVSSKLFNIIPSLPSFYFEGDKPQVAFLLQNSDSHDVAATIGFRIKEIGANSSQNIQVKANDFVTSQFDADLSNAKGEISFEFEAKDENGKVLDSVLLKRPILPRGSIDATWNSYVGSRDITFAPDYPKLDYNAIHVRVTPNIISQLLGKNSYIGIDENLSSETGKSLYAFAYILARTRDGFIAPTDYRYASILNRYRNAISKLQASRDGDVWRYPQYFNGSYAAANLWVAEGFKQGKENGILGQITNVDEIVSKTREAVYSKYKKPMPTEIPLPSTTPAPTIVPTGGTDYFTIDDKEANGFLLGESLAVQKGDEVLIAALDVLYGRAPVGRLIALKMQSADDRYIWNVKDRDVMTLAALAVIKKGSIDDADRAIKGLSIINQGNADSLMLFSAATYAERKGIYIAIPEYSVSINGVKAVDMTVKNWQNSYGGGEFDQAYDAKSASDGKVVIAVKADGKVPVYTTVTAFNYSSKKQDIGQAKKASFALTRTIKDANTKVDVTDLAKENSGIITLKSDVPGQSPENQQLNPFKFLAVEPLRPDYIYLNQSSFNSPQYHNVLDDLYPGNQQYSVGYIAPLTYSDQMVKYDNRSQNSSQIVMPYVVYRSAGGSYYQPKASMVFTDLGIVVGE